MADQRTQVLPKSPIGQAVIYATNQWPTHVVYLTDGRLTIDNGPAEQVIRPLCVGRRNRLHLGGDGRLRRKAVLLSIAASAQRRGINPWGYLSHVLAERPASTPAADLGDLLPDASAKSRGETHRRED